MNYYNTNNPDITTAFFDAMTDCIGADGGLYLPTSFPTVPTAFINNMSDMSLREIAYVTSNLFLGSDMDSEAIKYIVDKAFPAEFRMVGLPSDTYVLELFHGPTMSFKDIGIRFLAGMIRYLRRYGGRKVSVLVSSTGNTASAVIDAFGDIDDADVFILQPKSSGNRLFCSGCRELPANIHILDIDGNIDDCKDMVTKAMSDPLLKDKTLMTSANSVNVARIIAQVAIFFYASARLRACGVDASAVDFSLPSGNLSLLTAGVFARSIGLKSGTLIAACNANSCFDSYLKTGILSAKTPVSTPARFMDTAHPSNLPRIKALYHGDVDAMRRDILSASIGNALIAQTIYNLDRTTGYVADPHTAVGIAALDARPDRSRPAIVFATAHPLRSADYMAEICGRPFKQNSSDNRFNIKTSKRIILPPTFPALRKYILSCQ